ncbi:MAG TPA: hypothetical protein VFQ44_10565 [Streptosporangiaceae bacterium]|nr:hypothetical protein [Streptosporangiaceae bacterium]
MEVSITLAGPDGAGTDGAGADGAGADGPAGLESLDGWLRGETELAGQIRPSVPQPRPGDMGALPEALIVAVGSGGAVSALAAALSGWLSQPRRSDIRVRVEVPGDRVVEVGGDRVRADQIESLLRQALDIPGKAED